MPKFIPKTPCPNCHKKTWQLTTKASIDFCPHCHINLYPSKPTNQDKKPKRVMNKKIALFLSSCIGISVYMNNIFREELQNNFQSQMVMNTVLGLMVFLVVCMIIKSMIKEFCSRESKYQVGVDTLGQVTEDSCDYTQGHGCYHQCKNCQSFRLVDMYWFKRILAKNHEEIPVMAKIGDTDRFIGCLYCKTQYKRSPQYSSKIEKKFAIGLGAFLFMLLLASTVLSQYISNILALIPEKYGLLGSIFCGLYCYGAFTQERRDLGSLYPLIKVS